MKVFLDAYLNNNLGDDLMIQMVANRYPQHQFYIYNCNVLSSPACKSNNLVVMKSILPTEKQYLLRLINKVLSFFHIPKIQLIRHFRRQSYDLHLELGGSIFMQVTPRSWINKVRDSEYILRHCRHNAIVGCNFGPYSNKEFLQKHKKLFQKYEVVTFRDTPSYNSFKELKNVKLFPDIIFNMQIVPEFFYKNIVGISVISLSNIGICRQKEKYMDGMISLINRLKNKYKIILMSFCQNEGDLDTCIALKASGNFSDLQVEIYNHTDVGESIKVISKFSAMVCTRFHASVLAICRNIPFVPVVYSSKITHMLDDLNYRDYRWLIKDGTSIDLDVACSQLERAPSVDFYVSEKSKGHIEVLDKFLG